ncbi:MAG: hypothetical protein H6R15_2842 [Proteobacteria bacterium]|nr:hypothetical protein [Pseudomonadota bacterium]
MKIASAQLQMASTHFSQTQYTSSESLNVWVGERRPNGRDNAAPAALPSEPVSLSEAGRQSAATDSVSHDIEQAIDNDPQLSLIRSMLEFLTGRRIQVYSVASEPEQSADSAPAAAPPGQTSAAGDPPPSAGYGIEYEHHESYSETEQTSFSASGTVKTADGRTLNFNLELSMTRHYYEESNVSLRLGDAARQTDPLVINFAGSAAQLTDQRFAFDLNTDGQPEQINFLQPGSGFLAFDRNHDGTINNGSELFGPSSGDGFAELSKLDDDHNGWIDENDAAFGQLQVWSRDNAGRNQLQTLAGAGIGALALSHTSTPFAIKTNANQLLGEIRSSGIFLQEDGSTGTIQQIDLTA